MPRTGLELLEATFDNETENTKALGHLLVAIEQGSLTVNGQKPDEDYPIGEYLLHGGRVKFDLTQLSEKEQQEFVDFITNKVAKPRAAATHGVGGTDASGSPTEVKTSPVGEAFRATIPFTTQKHYGINLAIGGKTCREGVPLSLGKVPDETGEWGHEYVHINDVVVDKGGENERKAKVVLVGIEASAPLTDNKRTGASHSIFGAAGEESPFLEAKLGSEKLQKEQENAEKTPLTTKEKYNWATVAVSSAQLRAMVTRANEIDLKGGNKGYAELVNARPEGAEKAADDRFKRMEIWAKATKDGNKTSLIATLFAPLLAVVAAVAGFLGFGTHGSVKSKAEQLHEKRVQAYEEGLPRKEQADDNNHSPNVLVTGLNVHEPVKSTEPSVTMGKVGAQQNTDVKPNVTVVDDRAESLDDHHQKTF